MPSLTSGSDKVTSRVLSVVVVTVVTVSVLAVTSSLNRVAATGHHTPNLGLTPVGNKQVRHIQYQQVYRTSFTLYISINRDYHVTLPVGCHHHLTLLVVYVIIT